MSSSDEGTTSPSTSQNKYKGVRRRKWGKWVSEIRVLGTQERLWLGSYITPEAAAVAHDIAYYCLRENTSLHDFNFPVVLPVGIERGMSPRSVQKAATDAGMAIDAQFIEKRTAADDQTMEENAANSGQSTINGYYNALSIPSSSSSWDQNNGYGNDDLNISVEDYL